MLSRKHLPLQERKLIEISFKEKTSILLEEMEGIPFGGFTNSPGDFESGYIVFRGKIRIPLMGDKTLQEL